MEIQDETLSLCVKILASQRNVSDWVIGLGGIENMILKHFETPLICLMLLKYLR